MQQSPVPALSGSSHPQMRHCSTTPPAPPPPLIIIDIAIEEPIAWIARLRALLHILHRCFSGGFSGYMHTPHSHARPLFRDCDRPIPPPMRTGDAKVAVVGRTVTVSAGFLVDTVRCSKPGGDPRWLGRRSADAVAARRTEDGVRGSSMNVPFEIAVVRLCTELIEGERR